MLQDGQYRRSIVQRSFHAIRKYRSSASTKDDQRVLKTDSGVEWSHAREVRGLQKLLQGFPTGSGATVMGLQVLTS